VNRKGLVWFAAQGCIALGLLIAPLLFRASFPSFVRLGGAAMIITGTVLIVWSYRVLGKSHSPWTVPLKGASLVTCGPYRIVRHPVYLGYMVAGFGLEMAFPTVIGLVVAMVGFIYYDLRTREEERWLHKVYPAYSDYCTRVSGRIVPGLY
jgi:protein-S-isoprenylcysteine O-methyltransferase Ste14